MSVLGTLLKRNRIWVLGSVIAALFSNLSQLFYTYYVGQLVNKIESRAAIGMSFIILLLLVFQLCLLQLGYLSFRLNFH